MDYNELIEVRNLQIENMRDCVTNGVKISMAEKKAYRDVLDEIAKYKDLG